MPSIQALWFCDDLTGLERPVFQTDLNDSDRKRLGSLGGFCSYRMQGRGAGIGNRIEWEAFIDLLARFNPSMNLDRFRSVRL